MAREIDWANVLNIKDEPTFEEKWAASLADIGIFPTEKIYGKDIQTPTIGIEPAKWTSPEEREELRKKHRETWESFSPEKQAEITKRGREADERIALREEQEEQKRKEELARQKREAERIRLEKEKYLGVTYEEYKRRIERGWDFYPRGSTLYPRGHWTPPYSTFGGGATAPGTGYSPEYAARKKLEKEYPELADKQSRINKAIRSKEFMALSPLEQDKQHDIWAKQIRDIKDRADKKLQVEATARKKAETELQPDEVMALIKAANDGEISKGGVAYILRLQGMEDDYIDNVLDGITEPPTAVETEEIATSRAVREQKAKENELVDEWADEYPWLRLSDKKAGLFQAALEAKRRYDLDEDEQTFRQILDDGKSEFEQQQATTAQGNWVTERQDKLDVLEEKKRQWTKEFGADRAQELVDNEMITLDYLERKRAAESNEEITKDRDLMNYTIEGIKEEHSWEQALHTMGMDNREFNQNAWQFMQTMDWNKIKEQNRAFETGQTYQLSVQQEANAVRQFKKSLTKEYADLNLRINKYGLDVQTEARLAQTAAFTALERIKKLGLEEAKLEWEKIKTGQKWIFDKAYYQIDNEKARAYILKTMSDIYNNAEKLGTEQAYKKALVTNMKDTLQFKYDELAQKDVGIVVELSPELSTTLSNMPEYQDSVIKAVKSAYNEKTGKFYEPSRTEYNEVSDFLFGAEEDDDREKERFGVNLSAEDYIEQCINTFGWSDELKGWSIKNRDDPTLWNTIIAAGTANDSYISPDIEEAIKKPGWWQIDTGMGGAFRKIGETFKNWFTFTEPVAPGVEPTTRVTRTGNIATDAENILTQYDEEISRSDMRKYLSDMGHSEAEINSILGG